MVGWCNLAERGACEVPGSVPFNFMIIFFDLLNIFSFR